MDTSPTMNALCFGPFKLDLKAGELHKDGRIIRLQEQPFRILKMLLDRPGEIVTREEIRQQLWRNDTIVEFDHSINAAIKKLRLVLGDSAEKPIYVETVGRRGYRVIASLKEAAAQAGRPEQDSPEERLSLRSEAEVTILGELRAEKDDPKRKKLTGLIWLVSLSALILAGAAWFYSYRSRTEPSAK